MHSGLFRVLEYCDRFWTTRIVPRRILLAARLNRPLSVDEARQLASFAPADYAAE